MSGVQTELEQVARKTEGFDAADLGVLLERAVHAVRWQRVVARSTAQPVITPEQWKEALAGFQPAAAWEAGADGSVDARCVVVAISGFLWPECRLGLPEK